MKIEKMNDHQIRCTLTSEDLATRNIKLSELAYGSEKTRALFRDMMQQAAMDFGFEAEDIPLMVEAIPLSSEKIVVIITKVESPDELDTRFSNFTQFETEEDESDDGLPLDLDADSIDTSDVDDTAKQKKKKRQKQTENCHPIWSACSPVLISMPLFWLLRHCMVFIRAKIHYTKILRNTPII